MAKYFMSLILMLVSVSAVAAPTPTCDDVAKQVDLGAKRNGMVLLGSEGIPGGQVILWANKKETAVLVFTAQPLKDTKVFQARGQCTSPRGDIGLIYTAVIANDQPI